MMTAILARVLFVLVVAALFACAVSSGPRIEGTVPPVLFRRDGTFVDSVIVAPKVPLPVPAHCPPVVVNPAAVRRMLWQWRTAAFVWPMVREDCNGVRV